MIAPSNRLSSVDFQSLVGVKGSAAVVVDVATLSRQQKDAPPPLFLFFILFLSLT